MNTWNSGRQLWSGVVPVWLGLERCLHPVIAYVILPRFVLFDARVVIDSGAAKALARPVGLGVLFGLLIGTQVGITLASWIVVRFGLAEMPAALIQAKSTARRF